jgi:hypothetical protein
MLCCLLVPMFMLDIGLRRPPASSQVEEVAVLNRDAEPAIAKRAVCSILDRTASG